MKLKKNIEHMIFFCENTKRLHIENLFWSKLNNSISHSSVSAWLSPISTPESIQSKPIFHPLVLIIVILGNGTSPYHLIHLKVIPWHNQSHKKTVYCNQPTHYSSFCCYPFFQLDIQFWIMSSSIITFKPILRQDNFNDQVYAFHITPWIFLK